MGGRSRRGWLPGLAVWVCGLGWATLALASEQSAWVSAIRALESNGPAAESQRLIETFQRDFPASSLRSVADYAWAETRFLQGDYAGALPVYSRLTEQTPAPDFVESAFFRWGECLANQGQATAADLIWERLQLRFPQTYLRPEIELEQCRRLTLRGEASNAASRYLRLMSQYPHYRENPDLILGFARIDRFYHNDRGVVQRLIDLKTPEAVYLKGTSQLELLRFQDLLRSLRLDPGRDPLDPVLAAVDAALLWKLFERSQFASARQGVEQLLARNELAPALRDDLLLFNGCCRFFQQDYPAALDALTQWERSGARSRGDQQQAEYLLGLSAFGAGQSDRAQSWLKPLAEQHENEALSQRARLRLIEVAAGRGQSLTARADFQVFVQQNPAHPEASDLAGRLVLLFTQQGNTETAQFFQGMTPVRTRPAGPKIEPSPLLTGLRDRLLQPVAALESGNLPSQCRITVSPWLDLITRPPVLVINAPATAFEVYGWNFEVANRHDTSLFRQAGEGRMPASLNWDGRDPQGQMVRVGEPFTYVLTLKDARGKVMSTPAKSASLNSLAYADRQHQVVALLSSLIFQSREPVQFTPMGISFLKAASDLLVRRLTQGVHLEVRAKTYEHALAQGEVIRAYLMEKLSLPRAVIALEALPLVSDEAETVLLDAR